MARLPDASDDDAVSERIKARRGGHLTPLDRVLLHSPPVADGWNALMGAVRDETTLPADVRELVICKVAHINDAQYEWAAHAPIARASGATQEQLDALRTDDHVDLAPAQRVAVDYATAMTRDVTVTEDLFTRVRAKFDERQVVELTATVGSYNLVSRFLVAMNIQPHDDTDGGVP